MTNQHPITPSPELVQQWVDLLSQGSMKAFTVAYQAGADQELEACCQWLKLEGHEHEYIELRAARRPKPPSLKEQALKRLESLEKLAEAMGHDSDDTIRRALEALPND
jgi:hypothetical protein